jgi:mRNA interferase MazF
MAAITSKCDDKLYPTEVLIPMNEGGISQDSVVLLNQIRSLDCQRLVRKIGKISDKSMKKVDLAIKISLALIDF